MDLPMNVQNHTMQEFFLQGFISIDQKDILNTRLKGLCKLYSRFKDLEMIFSSPSTSNNTISVRRSLLSPNTPHIVKHNGLLEVEKSVLRRVCIMSSTSSNVTSFLKDIGYIKDFEYILEGDTFSMGRVKILIFTLSKLPVDSDQGSFDCETLLTSKNLLVEICGFGESTDMSIRQEVLFASEMLKPLVTINKADLSLYGNK